LSPSGGGRGRKREHRRSKILPLNPPPEGEIYRAPTPEGDKTRFSPISSASPISPISPASPFLPLLINH